MLIQPHLSGSATDEREEGCAGGGRAGKTPSLWFVCLLVFFLCPFVAEKASRSPCTCVGLGQLGIKKLQPAGGRHEKVSGHISNQFKFDVGIKRENPEPLILQTRKIFFLLQDPF